ncbi:MAG: efflux RND transporter periplasmic adaptor subunit [Bacteroides sp.]|nr:efflux RND transporter periplasmic adaptor subunit [Bacteroides sp.]MCM1379968.1 efflux RND transporter periplasmic adaptor subunit [Bacteroides sp.]MCM1446277.1 efflux RND transporter periplasmic adaptor subunit [Prevotella sp.]
MKISQLYIVMVVGFGLAAMTSCGFKKEKITQSPPIKVTVMPASLSASYVGRSYSGTVASGDGAEVSFSMPGTVENIYVQAGQKVSKGQLLAKLKSGTLENNYNIAKSALAEAQDAYDRFKQLHDAKALADMRWVEVQNTLKQAQNAADIARRALDDALVHAPLSGTVAEKLIDVGQTVVPAVPAFRIIALGDVKVTIPVPEDEISSFSEGETAEIKVVALDSLKLTGHLTEKGIVANPLTRAYEVKFSVDNSSGKLLPGMICDVIVNSDTVNAKNIVLPPQAVLLAADNRNFVWLAKNGYAEQRFVEVSDITSDGINIVSGIEPTDTVIIAGMQKVSDGTPISPQL